jgi:hypothetical protein
VRSSALHEYPWNALSTRDTDAVPFLPSRSSDSTLAHDGELYSGNGLIGSLL